MLNKSSKPTAAIITALLALSILSAVTMPVMATITGRPNLLLVTSATVNPDGTLTATIDPTVNSLIQTKVWSTDSAADMVAIDLTGMTLTGAQTWLWLSRTGGAAIESGDAYYAGPIALDAITTVTVDFMNVTDPYSGETFWVGNNMVIGMLPTPKILPIGTEYWVKITDVAPASGIPSSDVAVSNNKWKPFETVQIAPTTGPAGTLIQVSGIALQASKLVNVTFSTGPADTTPLMTQVTTNANGTFTASFYATDLHITDTVTITSYVNVVYADATTVATSTAFDELGRVWLRVAATSGPSGNDFIAGDVSTLSDLVIAGNSFNPRGNLTLYWDWGMSSQVMLGIASPNSTGYFNTTVVVPIASLGTHKISAVDYSYNLNATVNVVPTLILSPDNGPIGTVVTATGYGFPSTTSSSVSNVTLTWMGYANKDVASALTDSNGHFVATFTVPHDFGGDHSVVALANDTVTTASATFTVNPTLIVTPSNSSQDGKTLTAIGSGLESEGAYSANINNNYLFLANDYDYDVPIRANATGDLIVEFVAAGFQPGWQVFSIYPENAVSPYKPTAKALFWITTVGSPLFDQLKALNSTVMDQINSLKPVITSIVGDIATIKTDVGTIKGTVTSIQGNVATIKTDLGVVKGNVPVDMTPAWIAVGLSLIAAIAAAIAAVGIFRKMA
jgi:hypothetical protein